MKKYLRDPRVRVVLAVLVVLLAGGTVTVATVDNGQAPSPTHQAPAPSAPSTTAPTDRGVTPGPGSDLRSDLKGESGISSADRAKNAELAERLAPRGPPAKSIAPKCVTDYSGHVYSARSATPTEFLLHYTVSPNVKGWGDVRGVQNYFINSRVGSAHFILDFEGHCLKMVPGDQKAWTQGNANSYAYSVEIIATGSESAVQWKAAPIFKQEILARLVRSVMDAHGLPIRRVDPIGCVFPPGWTDHYALECGNNHTDVRKHFPFRVFKRQLAEVR